MEECLGVFLKQTTFLLGGKKYKKINTDSAPACWSCRQRGSFRWCRKRRYTAMENWTVFTIWGSSLLLCSQLDILGTNSQGSCHIPIYISNICKRHVESNDTMACLVTGSFISLISHQLWSDIPNTQWVIQTILYAATSVTRERAGLDLHCVRGVNLELCWHDKLET